ncbi:MAG TPA: hypothetical protein VEC39_04860 [Vicinamibacterales bacterium]|nr:hypothetical protein [Vicinamibacterales bacterium]
MNTQGKIGRIAMALVAFALMTGMTPSAQQELVMEPLKDAGLNVYPAFEGWYQNPDGTYTLLIGYYNRNRKQVLDIPIGPDNKIEPGGPDQGQPTHFLVGRGWGTIAIKVPKDFGTKKLTWTLTANGKTATGVFGLTKGYQVEPFLDAAMGNKPPVLKLTEKGRDLTGPPPPLSEAPVITGVAGEPVAISYWITDDGHEEPPTGGSAAAPPPGGANAPPRRPRLSTILSKYRGPGDISFADSTPDIDPKENKVSTTATFSLPGEYFIRIEGNDSSGVGGGGFQCCWTTAYIKAVIKGGSTAK